MTSERRMTHWRDAGVVCTATSPFSRLRPVAVQAVTLRDGFWKPRMDANRDRGLVSLLTWLDVDDQTAPFRAYAADDAAGIRDGLETLKVNRRGMNRNRLRHVWRANFHAWLEACAFVIQSGDHRDTRALLDTFAAGIVKAHRDPEFRRVYHGDDFENSYGLGTPAHLIQAAVAHHRATGSEDFLRCAEGVADVICARFRGDRFAGHSGIEMALVELYRTTGRERYLDGARHLLAPLLSQEPVIGSGTRHVVRQTYLLCGGADYYAETGDRAYIDRLTAIWRDMNEGKLHLTGQLAVDRADSEQICAEAFDLRGGLFDNLMGGGFELCEAVGNAMWNWRMLMATADARYADLLERTLYNGFLAHVSLDHGAFHYLCPLSSNGNHAQRTPGAEPNTSCCPPNALRTIASLPGYVFSTSKEGVWVHLYDNCGVNGRLHDGTRVNIAQDTRYPWDGRIDIAVSPQSPSTFELNLRIPQWCRDPSVTVNGEVADVEPTPGTYCAIRRRWREGDRLTLDLPMPIVAVTGDSRARFLQGMVAVCRGPMVYCVESTDQPDVNLRDLSLPVAESALDDARVLAGCYRQSALLESFEARWSPKLLGGVVALQGPGLKMIPYYAWANRDSRSSMRTWMRRGETVSE
ncbi:MAG: hypothetical protein CMJ18_06990 [Phycisphaeraceae bacterium]|nr:hypothetical protein [Phycisphaeraceae bacterium]